MKPSQKGRVPLERALSKLGLCSRIEAASRIKSGFVKVHGKIELDPRRMINPDTAHIEIEGKKQTKAETVLILFHKPKGVVTTKRDPEGRTTVFDLLPEEYQSFHAVGRLDMHTTGALLFTNDTQLSNYLTDPKNQISRVYIVKVKGKISSEVLLQMTNGITDADQILKADEVKIIKIGTKESTLEMLLSEGKYREIRRLCLSLGHEVITLKRISYGPYELLDLASGGLKIVKSTDLI